MELELINIAVDVSEATYPDKMHQFNLWNPEDLDVFKTNNFDGFVASDEHVIFLAFRGTQNNWKTLEGFGNSLGQWLTNANFRQIDIGHGRIHKGFNEELNSGFARVKTLLHKHGIQKKYLILTGHSAGGGLAVLAGDRLCRELGITDAYVCTFSAPKVGDRYFGGAYPLQHLRIEAKNDLVPFFPLHPAIYNFVGETVLFHIMNFVDRLFPRLNLAALRDVEYYHTGQLLYMTDDETLIHRSSDDIWDFLGTIFEDMLENIWDEDYGQGNQKNSKILSLPKQVVDVARVIKIFEEIDTSLRTGKVSFYKDHGIDTLSVFLKKLLFQ